MKYLRHSNIGWFIDMTQNIAGNCYPYIEISLEQEKEVLEQLSKGILVRVINGEITYLVDENKKRNKIVSERNNLLVIAERFVDRPTYAEKLGLTSEDLEDAKEYYVRLLDMPNHYDESTDKQNWDFVFVDVYTSGKNSNKYQLFKPSFVK